MVQSTKSSTLHHLSNLDLLQLIVVRERLLFVLVFRFGLEFQHVTLLLLAAQFDSLTGILGAMRFCEVVKIRILNHLFRGAIAAK